MDDEFRSASEISALISAFFDRSVPKAVDGEFFIKTSYRSYVEVDQLIYIKFKENFEYTFPRKGKDYRYIFKNLLLNIEVKTHTSATDIVSRGEDIYVKYKGKESSRSIQKQMSDQSEAISTDVRAQLNITDQEVIVFSFVFFPNISENEFASTRPIKGDNGFIIFKESRFDMVLKHIARNFSSSSDSEPIHSIPEIFESSYSSWLNDLNRKIEADSTTRFFNELIKDEYWNESEVYDNIGEKLIIIEGNPGTGKTIRLLQIAYNLIKDGHHRPILLTYNKALAMEIKRLVDRSGFSELIVRNVDSFLIEQYRKLPDLDPNELVLVDNQYDEKWKGVLNRSAEQIELSHDVLLLDEAQDTPIIDYDILLKLFHNNNIVISYGDRQFVRNPLNWTERLLFEEFIVDDLSCRISKRNKKNLVDFFNEFSRSYDPLNAWNLKSDINTGGGSIILTNRSDRTLFAVLNRKLSETGLKERDLLVIHPSDVQTGYFEELGIGVNFSYYSSRAGKDFKFQESAHRCVHFKSSRGLEGFVVVIYELDKILEEIKSGRSDEDQDIRSVISDWLQMLFTRAIDTLVIIVDDRSSKISQVLQRVSQIDAYRNFFKIELSE
jgi:hypothetical protein